MTNRVWKAAGLLTGVLLFAAGTGTGVQAAETSTEITNDDNSSYGTVTASALRMRNTPSLEGTQIDLAARGETVEILGQDGDWYQVSYDGNEGYMFAEYISLDDAEAVIEQIDATEDEDISDNSAEEADEADEAADTDEAEAAADDAEADTEDIDEAEDAADDAEVEGEDDTDEEDETSSMSITQEELDLLAALIQCEAGGESETGKIAVGAVVLNRVNSSSFPNTISEVIYQSGQFSPAFNGTLSSVLASGAREDCYAAAEAALAGENPVGDCLYFNCGSGQGIQIGNQHFY